MTKRVKVAVTGAGGQIGYSLLFRLASGEVFGKDTVVDLHLLELAEAIKAAEGTAMELADCAFPTLGEVQCYSDAGQAFSGVNWALLVGSRPRGPGMERKDLIRINGPIFVDQGQALNKASSDVRVVVVGNPCNTNALIAMRNCPDIPDERFSAMTALDENRAKAQLAQKAGCSVQDVTNLAIWGNHSTTMFPDFESAFIKGKPVTHSITDRKWLETDFITTVQNRGAAIIQARGKSSAASAASACIDHVKRLSTPTAPGDWFSAGVVSDGEHYGIPEGLIYSVPLRVKKDGTYEIVQGVALSPFAQEKLKKTTAELLEERDVIKDLL